MHIPKYIDLLTNLEKTDAGSRYDLWKRFEKLKAFLILSEC